MGRPNEALADFEQARAIQERLATAQPDNDYAQAEAASTVLDIGANKARTARATRGYGCAARP